MGSTQAQAAGDTEAPKLLLEVHNNGGLDLGSWDGAVTWFGVLIGFYFLLRSPKYLRKGGAPDEFKCVRWRNVTWARNHSTKDAPMRHLAWIAMKLCYFTSTRRMIFWDRELTTTLNANIKCNKDQRLCIPTLLNKLRK